MGLNGIAGKIALVTGVARRRGIGRATALRLAAAGADVACLDIARPYDDFPGYGVADDDELDEVRGAQRQRRTHHGVSAGQPGSPSATGFQYSRHQTIRPSRYSAALIPRHRSRAPDARCSASISHSARTTSPRTAR
jgi:NAD(P)-dependent dehydrogenase (short-subunit alcohol dehydrogenase family)